MKDITANEMRLVLTLFKSPATQYNASSMAKAIGISAMGALKIARRLEEEGTLSSQQLGRATFYRLNLDRAEVRQYVSFLLKREARQASAYVKRWSTECQKLRSATAIILFGSVLRRQQEAKDIDVLLVTTRQRFAQLRREVAAIDALSTKKLHPLYQTPEDLQENVRQRDPVVLNAVKGIVAFGDERLVELMSP